jgi:glyoxylase-like metal-dependent hydrolase (beta-lactamase superfamily II)
LIYPTPAAQGSPCWIIDPSFEPAPLLDRVRELGLVPELLILTHAHVDHMAGVSDVLRAFPRLPVLLHASESEWLGDPAKNLGAAIGFFETCRGPDRTLNEGDVLELAGSRWHVIHTPGHSPGGVTLHSPAQHIAIVGDTLFAGSVGRTDFPGSDPGTLTESIRRKLYTLPDDTTIYPGHGPSSTIGREKRTNPFVRA